MKESLTHLDERGEAQMVDVGGKAVTDRRALAEARLVMQPDTLERILTGGIPKGDVFAVARVAGIQAAKRCAELIPLCHPLPLTGVTVSFEPEPPDAVRIEVECRVSGRTGVEMEALTGASIAALTVYDMCKAIDRGMHVEGLGLVVKTGGASGTWRRGTP